MRSRRGALRHRFSAWLRTFTLDYLPETDPPGAKTQTPPKELRGWATAAEPYEAL
jgi:hypothetical protein